MYARPTEIKTVEGRYGMEKKNVLLYTNNHRGSLEQVFSTYALYQTLKELGWEPVVYDEPRKGCTRGESYLDAHCCTVSGMKMHTERTEYLNSFEAIVTGGDRKWECAKKESIDKCFLNWGNPEARRIAYAPTFGEKCSLPLGPKNAARFLLQRFHAISVSDHVTQRILNLEFQIDAETVCNPVLLSAGFAHEDVKKVEGLFISAFFEKTNGQKLKVAEMAEETLRYKVLNYSRENVIRKHITIDEYLSAIEKSAFIITDSAIVMYLAVVYKKPFVLVLSHRECETFSGLSMLETLGLMERVIYTEEDVREKKYLCRKPVKYGLVDYKLGKLRGKSIQWLETSLNGQGTDE